jgi:Peptidase S46
VSPEAVQKSDDGMIRLARILDSPNRQLRKRQEDTIEAALTASASQIAQARFATGGASTYLDATFTFRIDYSPVKGGTF